MTDAKLQHYIPQFLLRAFEAHPGSGQIYVYDKAEGTEFLAGTRRVGAEHAFNEIRFGDIVLSFEPGLASIESRVAPIIAEIRDRAEIGWLDTRQRRNIAEFVMVQSSRTRQFRENVREMGRRIHDALAAEDPTAPSRLGLEVPTDDQIKALSLRQLQQATGRAPLLESKAWALYESPPDSPFWLGDHPVVLNNELNRSDVRGTIGFAVPGIEIYMPISPSLCLAFVCPSIRAMFSEARRRASRARDAGAPLRDHDRIGATDDGFALGLSILLASENVEYINSLAALWSERFVFAAGADFLLLESMIESNPNIRRGPRPSTM